MDFSDSFFFILLLPTISGQFGSLTHSVSYFTRVRSCHCQLTYPSPLSKGVTSAYRARRKIGLQINQPKRALVRAKRPTDTDTGGKPGDIRFALPVPYARNAPESAGYHSACSAHGSAVNRDGRVGFISFATTSTRHQAGRFPSPLLCFLQLPPLFVPHFFFRERFCHKQINNRIEK